MKIQTIAPPPPTHVSAFDTLCWVPADFLTRTDAGASPSTRNESGCRKRWKRFNFYRTYQVCRALQPAIDKFKLAVRNGVHQENANEDEKIRDLRPEEVGTRRFPYRLSFAMPTDVSQSKCHDSNVFARGPAEKCPASLRSTSSQESIWSE
ncbi:uncharacterized protein BKA78DRAFT_299908 [Phyllosticta capitalensis]|uniref:uncharacterized protein n=1 Tax=Phyllosticta capitalensis TaxID=121624 RepID=UPI00312EF94D